MAKLSDYQKCLKRHSTKEPRTKAGFRKIQRMCRTKKTGGKRKTGRRSGRHGHTKRGLAQDRRMKSQEPHEKYYRRSKRK